MAEIYESTNDGRLRAGRSNPVLPVIIALAVAVAIYFLVAWALRPAITGRAASNAQPAARYDTVNPAPYSTPNTYQGANSSAPAPSGPNTNRMSSSSNGSSDMQGSNMVAPPGPATNQTGATSR